MKLERSGIEHVTLIANVVEQRLALLHPETAEPIQKVMFGSCYYGCDLIQVGMLHNQGPTSVKFVAVMEEDTVGQEIVSTIFFSKLHLEKKVCLHLKLLLVIFCTFQTKQMCGWCNG